MGTELLFGEMGKSGKQWRGLYKSVEVINACH